MLPYEKEISRDDMNKDISDVILDVYSDTSGVFALIQEEERNEGAI